MGENKIYLSSIAGYEEEKKEAMKIINMIKNYSSFSKKGASIPKGLILSGRPGVGKTMLAKAIANEAGAPFYELELNETSNEAKTINAIKALFAKAKENVPSIMFIDELDELVMTDDFISDYSRKTLKVLLTEIDGVKNSEGVLLIATTNYRDRLPQALIRSGRMDKKITIDLPDIYAREAIFNLYMKDNAYFNDVDTKSLARKTPEFSGADIKTLINEVLTNCICEGKEKCTIRDFEKKIPEIKFNDITRKQRCGVTEDIIYHELGHFICGFELDNDIGSVSTQKVGEAVGHVSFEEVFAREMFFEEDLRGNEKRDDTLNGIIKALGGYAAEQAILGKTSTGSRSDIDKARLIARRLLSSGVFGFEYLGDNQFVRLVSSARLEAIENKETEILNQSLKDAIEIVNNNMDLIKYLYKPLKEREVLSSDEIISLIKEYNEAETIN